VAAVAVLRRKLPDAQRPYRMWGYPWTLALFVASSVWFMADAAVTQPLPSAMALAIVGAGALAYRMARSRFPKRA
jgi:basic amino acid/polyamine antiporter, APA family